MTRHHLNRFAEGERPPRASSRRARRCRGCRTLLFAHQDCTPCETTTVYVITELGPTDGPGLIVHAHLFTSARRRPSPPGDPYRFAKAGQAIDDYVFTEGRWDL